MDASSPRTVTPVILLVLAVICLIYAVARRQEIPEWVYLALLFTGAILAVFGAFFAWDLFCHEYAARRMELAMPAIRLAQAVHGLTVNQLDTLATHTRIETIIRPGPEPLYTVRCIGADVPLEIVHEFFTRSQPGAPYLFPVRDFGNERYARAITDTAVNLGWAEPAVGPYSAKSRVPLKRLASHFGVSLD